MKTYLEPAEIERLEEEANCVRDRLLIRLIFWSGCRVSEALGVRVEDIDFNGGTVTIKHLKERIRLICPHCDTRLTRTARFCSGCGKEIPQPLKRQQSQHRRRAVPLDQKTLTMLQDFFKQSKRIKQDGNKALVFGIHRARAWGIIHDCAAKANIGKVINPTTGRPRGISPHRLRDAFATMVVQQDDSTDSMRLLQEMLGHTDIGTTLKYRKVAGRELKDWYQRLMTG